MDPSNADPALGAKGGCANEAYSNKAGHSESEDWNEKWFEALQR
jgi:hypothetical protein